MRNRIIKETLLKKNGVFVVLYSDNYGEREYDAKVIMTMRWNNNRGFLGGNVDEGETLREALNREVMEEGNFDISGKNVDWLSSYELSGFGVHSYVCKITPSEMEYIRRNYVDSGHTEEVSGILLTNLQTGDVNSNLLRCSFEATCKNELIDFMIRYIYMAPITDRSSMREISNSGSRSILEILYKKEIWGTIDRYIKFNKDKVSELVKASSLCLESPSKEIKLEVDKMVYTLSFDGEMFEMRIREDSVRSMDMNRFMLYCILYFRDICIVNEMYMGGKVRLKYEKI
ncbi:MAG: NUDIX domain-containing protein [Fusobacteriaceae bacterium]